MNSSKIQTTTSTEIILNQLLAICSDVYESVHHRRNFDIPELFDADTTILTSNLERLSELKCKNDVGSIESNLNFLERGTTLLKKIDR